MKIHIRYIKLVFMLASYAIFATTFTFWSTYIQTDIYICTNSPTCNFSHTSHVSRSYINTFWLQILIEPAIIKQMPWTFGFLKAGQNFSENKKEKEALNVTVWREFHWSPRGFHWQCEITAACWHLCLLARPDPFLCVSSGGIWNPEEFPSWQEQGNIMVFKNEKIFLILEVIIQKCN